MAKFCPIVGQKVVYLECQECEEHLCTRQASRNEKSEYLSQKAKRREKRQTAGKYF